MEQGDIIAYLYIRPETDESASAELMLSSRYRPPQLKPSRQYSRLERESTEEPEDPGTSSSLAHLPCLVVKFSDIPRTNRGLVFGSSECSDVVVDSRGISRSHFSLTFDEQRRLIVKDLGSLMGTQVTYDGRGEGARKQFQWIVSGHEIPEERKNIIITVKNLIAFRIIVPRHDISSPAYVRAVGRFCKGASNAAGLLDRLGPATSSTQFTPRTHTRRPFREGLSTWVTRKTSRRHAC